jgi:hypothetical protein
MTPVKRIQDMLPALIVFAVVAAFGTYSTIAFVVRDPWWINTLVQLREDPVVSQPAGTKPMKRKPAGAHRTSAR